MTAVQSSATTQGEVVLALPPEAVSIAVGRSVLRRIVRFRDDDAESSFLIAFTEIMSNAIDEHQRTENGAPIEVEVGFGPREFVSITDAGSGFLPVADAVPSVDIERGRGLALARAFVDDLQIESAPTGTRVTLPLGGLGIVR